MVVTSKCFAFRALITQARIWIEKGFELKTSTSLLYSPISSSAETWKIFRNILCQFFLAWADILSEKKPIFWKGLIYTRTSFVYNTSRLVRIFLLISALNKTVLLFFSGKIFYKSNRNFFSCVCISWYKHSRGWENSRQLCKPSTSSRVCITKKCNSWLRLPPLMTSAGFC